SRLRPAMVPGVYVNFMSGDEGDRVPEAYRHRWERLRAIKATYDPHNFFRLNQNIPAQHTEGACICESLNVHTPEFLRIEIGPALADNLTWRKLLACHLNTIDIRFAYGVACAASGGLCEKPKRGAHGHVRPVAVARLRLRRRGATVSGTDYWSGPRCSGCRR